MIAEVFTQRFVVPAEDIDELGHVSNIAYLRYAQDIAVAHWRARATPEMINDYVWVVTRHEVDYRASLLLNDEVEVRTWVDGAPRGATWARFVDIGKLGAEKPAARVVSNWCMLESASRRIRRVPAEIVARFFGQN